MNLTEEIISLSSTEEFLQMFKKKYKVKMSHKLQNRELSNQQNERRLDMKKKHKELFFQKDPKEREKYKCILNDEYQQLRHIEKLEVKELDKIQQLDRYNCRIKLEQQWVEKNNYLLVINKQ